MHVIAIVQKKNICRLRQNGIPLAKQGILAVHGKADRPFHDIVQLVAIRIALNYKNTIN